MLKNIHLIVLSLTTFLVLFYFTTIPIFVSAIAAFVFVTIIGVIGAFNIQLSFFTKSVSRIKTSEKVVFLTFDDGPSHNSTTQILDILKCNDIKAAFFCIGNRVFENKDIVQRIIQDGHIIGGHTLNHTWQYTFATNKKVTVEIEEGCKAIEHAIGMKVTLFRPPWGITNPIIAKASKELHLLNIGWSIGSYDTVIHVKQKIINRIISRLKPGSIILLHDRLDATAELLPDLIHCIKSKGFSIGALENYLQKD